MGAGNSGRLHDGRCKWPPFSSFLPVNAGDGAENAGGCAFGAAGPGQGPLGSLGSLGLLDWGAGASGQWPVASSRWPVADTRRLGDLLTWRSGTQGPGGLRAGGLRAGGLRALRACGLAGLAGLAGFAGLAALRVLRALRALRPCGPCGPCGLGALRAWGLAGFGGFGGLGAWGLGGLGALGATLLAPAGQGARRPPASIMSFLFSCLLLFASFFPPSLFQLLPVLRAYDHPFNAGDAPKCSGQEFRGGGLRARCSGGWEPVAGGQ